MTCQKQLMKEGKSYPRTCEECGLGPCHYDEPVACLPNAVTLKLEPRPDGGLRVSSDDVPGLVLSHKHPAKVMADILPALRGILEHNG